MGQDPMVDEVGDMAGAAFAAARVPVPEPVDTSARIAIVGAGIAGLTAAFSLAQRGVRATVYEASDRVGGRVHSNAGGYWAEDQVSEWCGELIDSDHDAICALARVFGLRLTDLLAAEPPGSTSTRYFLGSYYTTEQADADFAPVYEALQRDLAAAGPQTTWATHTAAGLALDSLSVYDWIESRVPGGHSSPLGRLLDTACRVEMGARTGDQSALNIVYMLAYQPDPRRLSIFGESDERYSIEGGNQRLPLALADSLPEPPRRGWRLRTLAASRDRTINLGFEVDNSLAEIVVDHVVLALPFASLRQLELAHAGFDSRKWAAIEQLGTGSSVKLALQFTRRCWTATGAWGRSNGSSLTDTGYGSSWESTRGQAGNSGILVCYTCGDVGGTTLGSGRFTDAQRDPSVSPYVRRVLDQLELVLPGMRDAWNGKATLSVPALDPLSRGSYPYYRIGQQGSIGSYEGVRQGNIHFAGDHCSQQFQGFMEGAAREGYRAACEILSDLAGSETLPVDAARAPAARTAEARATPANRAGRVEQATRMEDGGPSP
jgi:monoamine oxidase